MNYINAYSENCDYLRKRFNLSSDTNIYTFVGKLLEEIHKLDDEIASLKSQPKEKKDVRPSKRTNRNRPAAV